MKLITLILSMFVFLGCMTNVSAQPIEPKDREKQKPSHLSSKYDKAKDLTTVRIKQFSITKLRQEKQHAPNIPLHQMDLEVSYSFSGQKQTTPIGDVVFRFHAVGSSYVFSRGQQVIAALDREISGKDRAISLGPTDYKSEAPKFNSVYEEYMQVIMPAEAIARMAKATTLEVFVGPVGYVLTDKHLEALREMAATLASVPQ